VLKAIVETKIRRPLAGQGIGPGDVVKRMDIAATAIARKMTIDEVANLDLGYAPPYSSAMDPLINLANVMRNKLDGMFEGISAVEVKQKLDSGNDFVFLDVRSQDEYDTVHLPESTLIPLGALRDRLEELPTEGELITFCKISLRGYEAARILTGRGFKNVKVMEGGVLAWPFETESS
jgi:rhodanese-related sulfurtransferase